MTYNTAVENLFGDLIDLLEAERSALTGGDLDGVARLAEAKEALIERIGTESDLDRDDLLRLQEKLTRNQMLLNGAIDGIRSVSARMTQLQQVRNGFDSYGQDGRRTSASVASGGTLEKRA